MYKEELIKVKIEDKWVPACDYQKNTFINYKNNVRFIEKTYNCDNLSIRRIDNDYNKGIILQSSDGITTPIADWSNVKVFLIDQNPVNWYSSRNYQTWAYFDFIYDNKEIKSYKSKGTYGYDDHIEIEIDIDDLDTNIIFSISRNTNGTIFYQKNDEYQTKVRISDSEIVRKGYLGFYNRVFEADLGIIFNSDDNILPDPILPNHLDLVLIDDEEIVCAICNRYQQNIQFIPCNHTKTCSDCFIQLPNKKICPICRQNINSIIPYKLYQINGIRLDKIIN